MSPQTRILTIDDDSIVRHVTCRALEQVGFTVWSAASAGEAMQQLSTGGLPHLVLLEIGLRGENGLVLGRKLHDYSDVPIVVLSRVQSEDMVVTALDQFAEDYVTKPFSTMELLARVRRILRRLGDFGYTFEPTVRVDHRLSVELGRQQVLIDGGRAALTPTESKLLYILMRDAGRTVRTEFLLRRLWPLDDVYEDTLRVHIHRLRRKIEASPSRPRYVVTDRGVGYRFPSLPDVSQTPPLRQARRSVTV